MCKHFTLLARLASFQRQQENRGPGAPGKIKAYKEEKGEDTISFLIFSLEDPSFSFQEERGWAEEGEKLS